MCLLFSPDLAKHIDSSGEDLDLGCQRAFCPTPRLITQETLMFTKEQVGMCTARRSDFFHAQEI